MDNLSKIETVFLSALEKGSPAERAAYLDEACQGDPELRQSVERLLQAHPQVGSFLQLPPGASETTPPQDQGPLQDQGTEGLPRSLGLGISATTSCWRKSAAAAWGWFTRLGSGVSIAWLP